MQIFSNYCTGTSDSSIFAVFLGIITRCSIHWSSGLNSKIAICNMRHTWVPSFVIISASLLNNIMLIFIYTYIHNSKLRQIFGTKTVDINNVKFLRPIARRNSYVFKWGCFYFETIPGPFTRMLLYITSWAVFQNIGQSCTKRMWHCVCQLNGLYSLCLCSNQLDNVLLHVLTEIFMVTLDWIGTGRSL